MQSRPSKEAREILAREWRQNWRKKLRNDQSVFREAYEYPKRMWIRNVSIICILWTIVAGSIIGILALVGFRDTLIWGLLLVPMVLFFFFMYSVIAWNEKLKPGWIVIQITKKYFIYAQASTPDLDFIRMVHSEDKITYPQIAAHLETITKLKKGFGSYFVRGKPGGPGMIILAVGFGPGSEYGAGWEEEFPIPVQVLSELIVKVREIAPAIKIEIGQY